MEPTSEFVLDPSCIPSPTVDEIDQIVRRVQLGDSRALDQLLERCRPRLRQMIRMRMDTRLSSRLDPSDVVQEAFVTATQRIDEYLKSEPIPFYPWLRRIAWQKLAYAHEQHLDAQKRSVLQEQQHYWHLSDESAVCMARLIDGNLTSPSGAAVRKESRDRVQSALAQLTDLDREVLLQRYVERLTAKEIASALGLSEPAVHMRHMRALERLQRLLEPGRT